MNKILLISLFVCSFFTACTPLEEEAPMGNGEAICFTGNTASTSRSTASTFEAGDNITLFAFKSEQHLWSETNPPHASNLKYGYNGTLFAAIENSINYPKDTPLAFLAVYPYHASAAATYTFNVSADQNTGTNYSQSDLMTATTATTSEPIPNLAFNHRLASVVVNLTFEQMPSGTTQLDFSSVQSAVAVDLANSTFVGTGESTTPVRAAAYGTNSYRAILPPQTLATGTNFIVIATEGGHSYSYQLPAEIVLKSGKQRTFDLTVTAAGEVIVTTEEETDFNGKFTVRATNGSIEHTFISSKINYNSFIIDSHFYYFGENIDSDPTDDEADIGFMIDNYSPELESYAAIYLLGYKANDDAYPSFCSIINEEQPSEASARVSREGMNMKVVLSGKGYLFIDDSEPISANIVSGEFAFPLSFEGTMKRNIQTASELNLPNLGFELPFPVDEALVVIKNGTNVRLSELYYKEGNMATYDALKQKIEVAGYALQEESTAPDLSYKDGTWKKGEIVVNIYYTNYGHETIVGNDNIYHLSITVMGMPNTNTRSPSSPLPYMNQIKKLRNNQKR